jgi:saccharopine dehydrogenase (NAD+, L-lysine-forming)
MRVLVLGGGGDMAEVTARDVLQFYGSEISRIILADIDLKAANEVAARVGSDKVVAQYLDVFDNGGLISIMKDVDIVLNFIGPYYLFGIRVLQAAIQTKKNYIDIDDDSDSTLAKFDLDEEAKAAGITAIIGLGSGPGSDNILARHYAERLDEVDEINIYWVVNNWVSAGGLPPRRYTAHFYHGIQKAGPQYLDGELVDMPPLSGATEVDFDPPVGRAEVVYFAHPEPVTLPRYIKGVKKVTNRGGTLPAFSMGRLREAVHLGLTRDEPVNIKGNLVSPIDVMIALDKQVPPTEYLGQAMSGIRIEVRGRKDGKPQDYIRGGSTYTMAGATAGPTSIGVFMLAHGDIETKGVVAPEGCIYGPEKFAKFMAELKKRQI